MMDILEISDLTKDLGRFRLSDVSLHIPQGCIMGLIGEIGAGKSTLIKAILGLIQPDAGEVFYCDKKLDTNDKTVMEQIGVCFDSMHFHEQMTPEWVGRIHAKLYPNWDADCYEKFLQRFDLPMKSQIKGFSKGMQMKLNLAAAFSHHARLLLLDEPTAGLDPVVRDELMDIFLDFVQDETHSILLSTHITADLEKAADYVTFLHNGSLLFTRPTYELQYQFRIARCGEQEFHRLKTEKGAVWRKQDYSYEVLLPEGAALEGKVSCQLDRASIDEIMLMYVKGEQS